MANDYISNPILIDTAFTEGWKAEVATTLGSPLTLLVTKVEWLSPVTIGDKVIILDTSQLTTNLLDYTCEVALQSQIFDWTARPIRWRDFQVTQIDSGTLKIWYI